jgi:hypothetical protein
LKFTVKSDAKDDARKSPKSCDFGLFAGHPLFRLAIETQDKKIPAFGAGIFWFRDLDSNQD